MKKILFGWILAAGLLVPSVSQAYIGARIGVVDESNFGYSLIFGANLPKGIGIDGALTGFWKSETFNSVGYDRYWIQGDVDLSYDFNPILKERGYLKKFHPYLRAGFTYAGFLSYSDATTATGNEASYGPGFNFGGGIDWSVLPWLAVGVDLSESIVYLNGATIEGISFPDSTATIFSAMAGVKFFAY